jgi:hypothetical protein
MLLDNGGAVWDTATGKIKLRGRPPPQAALANGGQLLVEAGIEGDRSVFICRDLQTGLERRRVPLPEAWHFRVAPCGNGRLVAVNMESHPSRLKQPSWLEILLRRFSWSPRPLRVQAQKVVFDPDSGSAWIRPPVLSDYESAPEHCALIDTGDGQSLVQTAGSLRAVSDDCRFAVTEDSNPLAWKLWELPVRKPAATVALAVLAWSLTVIGLIALFRRRGVKLAVCPQTAGLRDG